MRPWDGCPGNAEWRARWPYVWFWRARLPERKGQPCRVLARGAMNSVLVQFLDGSKVIASRFAVRRAP